MRCSTSGIPINDICLSWLWFNLKTARGLYKQGTKAFPKDLVAQLQMRVDLEHRLLTWHSNPQHTSPLFKPRADFRINILDLALAAFDIFRMGEVVGPAAGCSHLPNSRLRAWPQMGIWLRDESPLGALRSTLIDTGNDT